MAISATNIFTKSMGSFPYLSSKANNSPPGMYSETKRKIKLFFRRRNFTSS